VTLFGMEGRTDAPEVLAAFEVDYTPSAVAVQLVLALDELTTLDTSLCLCPAAGSGVWARALRAVFGPWRGHPTPVIVGVDIRESERVNLARACNHVAIGDIKTLYGTVLDDGLGLVIDNPPFTAFSSYWPTMILDYGWLSPDAVVAFYGLSSWGQSAEAAPHLARWCPDLQIRVGGRIAHRGTGAADAREYSLWVWSVAGYRERKRAGLRRPDWRTHQLPALPASMRRWSPAAVPGTYPIEPGLVTEIRERFL
jgi:hypothetical protein